MNISRLALVAGACALSGCVVRVTPIAFLVRAAVKVSNTTDAYVRVIVDGRTALIAPGDQWRVGIGPYTTDVEIAVCRNVREEPYWDAKEGRRHTALNCDGIEQVFALVIRGRLGHAYEPTLHFFVVRERNRYYSIEQHIGELIPEASIRASGTLFFRPRRL